MRKRVFIYAILWLALASCSVEMPENLGTVHTGEASHVSCRNAVISGKMDKSLAEGTAPVEAGVLYSLNQGVIMGGATKQIATAFDSDYTFNIAISETLTPETVYYYRAYISSSKGVTYGEVKSFKTLSISSLIQTEEVTELKQNSAILQAALDLTDCTYSTLEYGFCFGVDGQEMRSEKSDNLSGKAYSVTSTNLVIETVYQYKAYVILDGQTYEGAMIRFTTPGIQATVTTGEVTNLDCSAATLHGHFSLIGDMSLEDAKFGFLYSTDKDRLETLKASTNKASVQLGEDGAFQNDISGLTANSTYYYLAYAELQQRSFFGEVLTFQTTEYVDLGLSVKWRNRNLGAATPQLNGDYYSWGETETKPIAQYSWYYYKWCEGTYTTLTKYNTDSAYGAIDNKTILDESDDVAHVKLGGGWRMPTSDEVKELVNNCSWTISQQPDGMGSSARGYLGISKKNGRRIFIPVSLYVAGGKKVSEGFSDGCFWTRSLRRASSSYVFSGTENNSVHPSVQVSAYTAFDRSYGLPIRPVIE